MICEVRTCFIFLPLLSTSLLSNRHFLIMASSHNPCHSILSNATIFGCEIICAREHLRSRQIICRAVQLSYNTSVICRYFLKQLFFCTKKFFGCHYPSKNGNNPFLKTHGLRPLSSRITVRASMLIIIHFGVSRWLSLQISTSDPLKRNSRIIFFALVVVNIYCVSFIPGSFFLLPHIASTPALRHLRINRFLISYLISKSARVRFWLRLVY